MSLKINGMFTILIIDVVNSCFAIIFLYVTIITLIYRNGTYYQYYYIIIEVLITIHFIYYTYIARSSSLEHRSAMANLTIVSSYYTLQQITNTNK